MALSSIGSIVDASQTAARSEDDIDTHHRPSTTGELGGVLASAHHRMTTSSPGSASSATIVTGSSNPANTLPTFMPTSMADIAALRNATRTTQK